MTQKPSPNREQLEKKIAAGRYALLLILVFTAVNLVMLLLNHDRYYLFSAAVPYYVTLFALGLDNRFSPLSWSEIGPGTTAALVISGVILALYFICLLVSTKRPGWLLGGLVMFCIDTAALVWISFALLDKPWVNAMDAFLHLWAIVELAQGVLAYKKLKKIPEEAPVDLNSIYSSLSQLHDSSEEIR